jgi:hypothetical protein
MSIVHDVEPKRERGWDSNSEKEKRGGKKIFLLLLSFLPPNLLVVL